MKSDLDRLLESIQHNTERKQRNGNKQAAADPAHDVKKNSVTKSNALVRAYYRFGLVEKRIMETLVSQLHPLRTDNQFQEIELTALTYSQAFSVSEKIAYRDLEKAVTGLMKRVISVSGEGINDDRIEFTLMARARYRKQQGKIICTFNPLIVPHLVGMTKKFTKYPLSQAVEFSSSYTWRFYELIMSWAKPKSETNGLIAGWLTVEVAELRDMLGVPKSYRWGRFQEMVLDVAQAELKAKANIHMDIERKKTSRKITHLNIRFIEDEQKTLPLTGGKVPKKKAA
ncbi:MAG: replication initiation protein [Thiolinea sp.]